MRDVNELIKLGIGKYIAHLYDSYHKYAKDIDEAFGGRQEVIEWLAYRFTQRKNISYDYDDSQIITYAYLYAKTNLVFELSDTLQRSYSLGRKCKNGDDIVTHKKKMYALPVGDYDKEVFVDRRKSVPDSVTDEVSIKEVIDFIYDVCDKEDQKPRPSYYKMTYSYHEMLDMFLEYNWDVKKISLATNQTTSAWGARKIKLMNLITEPVRAHFPSEVIGQAFIPTTRTN